jgi:hypothetical protein
VRMCVHVCVGDNGFPECLEKGSKDNFFIHCVILSDSNCR